MLNYILEKAAKWLGSIGKKEFMLIMENIVKLGGQDHLSGRDKFQRAVDYAVEIVLDNDVAEWIAQTVIQIVFALARRKGLV